MNDGMLNDMYVWWRINIRDWNRERNSIKKKSQMTNSNIMHNIEIQDINRRMTMLESHHISIEWKIFH